MDQVKAKQFGDEEYTCYIENVYGNGDNTDIQYIRYFDNGYGISILQSKYAYCDKENNTFEVAVINHEGDVVYDSGITDDVMGYQTVDEVFEIIDQIKNLPKRQ